MGGEGKDKRVLAIGMEEEGDGFPVWVEEWSGAGDGLVQELSDCEDGLQVKRVDWRPGDGQIVGGKRVRKRSEEECVVMIGSLLGLEGAPGGSF